MFVASCQRSVEDAAVLERPPELVAEVIASSDTVAVVKLRTLLKTVPCEEATHAYFLASLIRGQSSSVELRAGSEVIVGLQPDRLNAPPQVGADFLLFGASSMVESDQIVEVPSTIPILIPFSYGAFQSQNGVIDSSFNLFADASLYANSDGSFSNEVLWKTVEMSQLKARDQDQMSGIGCYSVEEEK
jgi:hypothetical protein